MKVKLIIISIILLLVMVFACGCIPFMEKIGLINPTDEEQLSPEKGGPPDGLVKVLIGFKEKPGAAQQAMVRGVGGKIKYTYNLIPVIAASVPEVAIEALKKNPNITNVELDSVVYALDDELDNSWGVKHIGAGVVHDSGNGGAGVKVAILDTGIDLSHPDLDVIGGANFSPGKSYDDKNGHGTHVAGIVAALDDGFGVIGVAPEVELYAVKVLGNSGMGWVSDIIAGLDWCVESTENIQVVNMSFGGADYVESLKLACSSAYDAGLFLVASAGNSGDLLGIGDNVGYPAAYGSVIAVAATDQNDERAPWSSTGPAVELAAPGVGIYSTYIGGGYATYSGTSMAAPHVTGTVALMIAAGITDIRNELQTTADDLGDPGRDPQYGFGLVDADEAAGAPPPQPNEPPIVSITSPADGDAFNLGDTILFEGTASDTEDGNLTADDLVWTSSIDGQIGEGGSFSSTTLSDGTHTITAVVTDSGGETGSASIGITVGTLITYNMHVSDIDMSFDDPTIAGINKFYTAIATVTIVDDNIEPNPVEGATVSGTWSGATTDVDSGVTDTNGQVSLESDKVKNPESGTTFTFTVDDVTNEGWTYNSPFPKPSESITY